jgi:hypothetical protein
MWFSTRSMVIFLATLLAGRVAQSQELESMPADYPQPAPDDESGSPPPIPPYVEGPAVQAAAGGYCFEGPHPVDSRVEPGVTWDNTPGRHIHGYPPFDLRLFAHQNGCYSFVGDPTDFGYAGDTYSYYGAHPILAAYGGGWCFMIGPHHHFWRPWSPLFVTVGPWFYWQGPYDPYFWTYWPYYHFYYRSHYPTYYSHGAFFRGHAVAPRITAVPRPPRYGGAWHGGYRGTAPVGPRPVGPRPMGPGPGASHGMPMPPRGAAPNPGPVMPRPAQAGSAAPAPHTFSPPAPRGFSTPAPHNFSPPASRGSSAPAPRFGGGHFGGRGRR